MYGIIYKITNKLDGTKYIGQTTQDLSIRWNSHCKKNSGCHYLSNAIKKYGKENFEIKILVKAHNKEELDYRESYCIKLFNTLSPKGYNLKSGGNSGGKLSIEVKTKISIARKGKRMLEETKRKISATTKGKKHKKHSEETKTKISNSKVGQPSYNKGKNMTKETKSRMSIAKKGKRSSPSTEFKKGQISNNRKQVVNIQNGMVWNSAKEAALACGIKTNTLICYLSGKSKNKTDLRYVKDLE
jgi:group I intron endonuclease